MLHRFYFALIFKIQQHLKRCDMQKILRLTAVKERTGLSRSGIYSMMTQGIFPRSISLSMRSVGWIEEEIDAWINQQIYKSRSKKEDK